MKSSAHIAIIIISIHALGYALTGGPAMPEHFDYESPSGGALVNHQSGDGVYTIPILRVPGPGGSYPIALSYHSGIQQDQEATWVGLGWSLTPGAITRRIRGVPDDLYNGLIASHMDHLQEGGTLAEFKANLGWDYKRVEKSYTNSNGTNVESGSWKRSYDNYGWGFSVGPGGNDGDGIPEPVAEPDVFYSGLNSSGGNQIGVNSVNATPGAYTSNMTSPGYVGGISGPGVGGLDYNVDVREGDFFTDSESEFKAHKSWWMKFTGAIFNRGYLQQNWVYGINTDWLDWAHGFLYQGGVSHIPPVLSKLQVPHKTIDLGKSLEMIPADGWAFPSADLYSCKAEGLGGGFMPFTVNDMVFVGDSDVRSFFNSEEVVEGDTVPLNAANQMVMAVGVGHPKLDLRKSNIQFRFLNDPGKNAITTSLQTQYDPVVKRNTDEGVEQSFGSQSIEPVFGSATGLIEGFRIVNSNGWVYEFSKPLYNLAAEVYITDEDPDAGAVNSDYKVHSRYAYAWLITEIHAPGDNGFWVKFKYTNKYCYKWGGESKRDIGSGVKRTVKNLGIKEMAYLEEIETATHKAVFEHSVREDGKGFWSGEYQPGDIAIPLDPAFEKGSTTDRYIGHPDEAETDKLNILVPGVYVDVIDKARAEGRPNLAIADITTRDAEGVASTTTLQVSDLRSWRAEGGGSILTIVPANVGLGAWETVTRITIRGEALKESVRLHKEDNTMKKLDRVRLYKKDRPSNDLWQVSFDYDYHLCPGTPNSDAADKTGIKGGKLSLNSLTISDGDQTEWPPYTFRYQTGNGNPNYGGIRNVDEWGMPKTGEPAGIAWNLTGVTNPSGGSITYEYERDTYRGVNRIQATGVDYGLPSAESIEVFEHN